MLKPINDFPDVVRIEASGACNFRCIHCPTGIQPNGRKQISRENFYFILEQFLKKSFIPRVVVLYHGGEPLLNKDLEHFIGVLKNLGVEKTVITTNASILNEVRSMGLILAGLDEMKVSFDGKSPIENNNIRKKGEFERQSKNLINFLELKKKLGKNNPSVRISNVFFADYDFFDKKRNKEKAPIPKFLLDTFRKYKNELQFTSSPAFVWPGFNKFDEFDIYEENSQKPNYCSRLFETFSILVDGSIVPCCYDLNADKIFGNVYEKNVFEIWNSNDFVKFREDFRRKNYPEVCSKCNFVNPRFLVKKKLNAS